MYFSTCFTTNKFIHGIISSSRIAESVSPDNLLHFTTIRLSFAQKGAQHV